VAGLADLIGQQPVAELRIILVGVEHGVRQVGLFEFPITDRVGEPAVIGLAGELQHPTRDHDGDPVDGQLRHERVHL
jgi:hypothetical protein